MKYTPTDIGGVTIVDIEPERDERGFFSPVFCASQFADHGLHVMVQLSADNRRALFLPPFIAHGFQTLTDNTEVLYQVSGVYDAEEEQGFRWDDPEFAIEWPLVVSAISEQDARWPLLASVSRVAS